MWAEIGNRWFWIALELRQSEIKSYNFDIKKKYALMLAAILTIIRIVAKVFGFKYLKC